MNMLASIPLYLPFEIQHLAHRPTLFSAGLILLNVILVIYLGKLLAQQRIHSQMPKKRVLPLRA
jgi:uncharacterized membrane protein (DUF2068 family)